MNDATLAKRLNKLTKAKPMAALQTKVPEPERLSPAALTHFAQTNPVRTNPASTTSDQRERQQLVEALRRSDERLHSILHSIEEVVWSVSPDGTELYFISPAAEQIYGRPTAEFYAHGQSWLDFVHPEDQAQLQHAFQLLVEADRYEVEYRIVRPDGEVRWLHDRGYFVYDEAGLPQRVDGVALDVTHCKLAQAALQMREAQLASIIDTVMDGIITIDESERIILFNRAAEQIFRCPASAALGQPLERFIPERFRAAHHQYIASVGLDGGTPSGMGGKHLLTGLRADGEEFPLEASISKVVRDGRPFFTAIHRDVTESLRASERLLEQAALLDQSHEAIVVRGLDGRIRYWSRGAERLYGWTAEEAQGRPVQELLYQSNPQALTDATRLTLERGEWNGELRQLNKQGGEVIVEGYWSLVRDADNQPKSILAINTDVTEKRKIEAQLLRAQRLESLGTLASGIAHDLNNVLSPILMGTQLLQTKLHDELCLRLVSVMQRNAQRGAEMIKQVLSFAKGMSGARVLLQPKHLIREVLQMAEETFPKAIQLETRLADGLWTVDGDATQLHQVLLNLCLNARDAMPYGGTLTITAANQLLDELYSQMRPHTAPGAYVAITVADTGVGIPPEILNRIFDPFFTTKEPGRGTGLGLATVQGIVTNHSGFITVESQPGAGTKFVVYLPAHESTLAQPPADRTRELPLGHGELILVVDDEAAIREMTRSALEAFGYRVLTAENGAMALSSFVVHQQEIGAVLTDLMMPVMDGFVTIRAMRKLSPQLSVLATTGLADPAKATELERLGVDALLLKPYNAEILLQTLARVLRMRRTALPTGQ